MLCAHSVSVCSEPTLALIAMVGCVCFGGLTSVTILVWMLLIPWIAVRRKVEEVDAKMKEKQKQQQSKGKGAVSNSNSNKGAGSKGEANGKANKNGGNRKNGARKSK